MTTRTQLTTHTVVDNGPALPPTLANRSLHRDVEIALEFHGNEIEAHAWGEPTFPQDGEQYVGSAALNRKSLDDAVSQCRAVWQREVIERALPSGGGKERPFVHRWDLSAPEDNRPLEEVGPKLAIAGYELFTLLFVDGDAGLRDIGRRLQSLLAAHPCCLTIHSSDCFVPWRMLYTPADCSIDLYAAEAPWSPQGFWGYRHVIEQKPHRRRGRSFALKPDGGLHIGLNVDAEIDARFNTPFVADLEGFLAGFASLRPLTKRTEKLVLRRDLVSGKFVDGLSYFGCHGIVAGDRQHPNITEPSLKLDEWITTSELKAWLAQRGAPLDCDPVVMINACDGGQMHSLFYESIATLLLEHGAHCLLGPDIELPVPFAGEFAKRLLERFLAGRKRLGEALREVTQELLDDHQNPLGLVYSLFYGLDTHLIEPVT